MAPHQMQHGTQRWLRPVGCVCGCVCTLLDGNLNAIVTHLHDVDAACLKVGGEGGGAISSGGCGEGCACGAIGGHGGACGKSAHGDGAALGADEHGL